MREGRYEISRTLVKMLSRGLRLQHWLQHVIPPPPVFTVFIDKQRSVAFVTAHEEIDISVVTEALMSTDPMMPCVIELI